MYVFVCGGGRCLFYWLCFSGEPSLRHPLLPGTGLFYAYCAGILHTPTLAFFLQLSPGFFISKLSFTIIS